ncbi:SAF domain-containing protein [uncultured Solobacterium sp.]|uniref:SAF domain-containing protein n=1 Tax=uncultured Solobacterium sp. TaxID=747375 RepID=UPI0028E91E5C|nr:SAF domain-containing protein [uncultured Solobacterium sp.]
MKKIKRTGIIVVILCLCVIGNVIAFRYYLAKTINLKTTYIAKHNIPPRTQIKTEDLTMIQIPEKYMQAYTWNEKADIIGKYTSIQGMIPKGSMFYKDMLYNEKEVRDLAITKLQEGMTIFTLETNVSSLGSIEEGMYADIHVSISQKKEIPITGILIRHAEVISIKDHKGLSLKDEQSTKVPYFIELGINQTDIDYLSLASSLGEIRLFPSADSYKPAKSTLEQNSKVTEYLKSLYP